MVHAIQVAAIIGFATAAYAFYVEHKLASAGPGYEAGCDLGTVFGINMSCTKVFTSSYGHILSHWGLVASGDALDFSLAEAGLAMYGAYFLYPILTFIPARKYLLVTVATGSSI